MLLLLFFLIFRMDIFNITPYVYSLDTFDIIKVPNYVTLSVSPSLFKLLFKDEDWIQVAAYRTSKFCFLIFSHWILPFIYRLYSNFNKPSAWFTPKTNYLSWKITGNKRYKILFMMYHNNIFVWFGQVRCKSEWESILNRRVNKSSSCFKLSRSLSIQWIKSNI